MPIDWTKPLRVKGQGWPVEVISDKGRYPGYPMLCYVDDSLEIKAFSCDGWDRNAYFQLENVPEKQYLLLNVENIAHSIGPFGLERMPHNLSRDYKLYELVETTIQKVKKEAGRGFKTCELSDD